MNEPSVDAPAVEERIPVERSLDKESEQDAADLVHCRQDIVGCTAGLYLCSLGDKVVLYLVKANIEHNKREARLVLASC